MRKIVVDTNVLVSALLTKGYSSRIIDELILSKKVKLCLSPPIFKEYVDVLFRKKFARYPSFVASAELVLAKMEELAIIYEPTIKLDLLKDKDDNKFLELAITTDASLLVTGNKNDFRISSYQTVKIVTPKECWDTLSAPDTHSYFSEPAARYRMMPSKTKLRQQKRKNILRAHR
jgi:uncharacterized protein